VAGASYSWSGPGGFNSTSRQPTLNNVNAGDAGNYTGAVTVSGCSAQSTTTVVVNNPPTANASNDGPACTGGNVQLSTPSVSGASYSWTGPNGFNSNSRQPVINGVNGGDAGNYTV